MSEIGKPKLEIRNEHVAKKQKARNEEGRRRFRAFSSPAAYLEFSTSNFGFPAQRAYGVFGSHCRLFLAVVVTAGSYLNIDSGAHPAWPSKYRTFAPRLWR